MSKEPDLSPLVGAQVTRLCLDYAVTLLLVAYDGGSEQRLGATLEIQTPFTVSTPGFRTTVVPDRVQNLAAVLGLLHSTIEAVTVSGDQTLTLTFDGSVTVTVPRDPHYESWELMGEGVEAWLVGPH